MEKNKNKEQEALSADPKIQTIRNSVAEMIAAVLNAGDRALDATAGRTVDAISAGASAFTKTLAFGKETPKKKNDGARHTSNSLAA